MRRGAVAPLRPVPPATPSSRSRAPPRFFSSPPANASRAHLGPEVPGPRRAAGSRGRRRQGRGRRGTEKLLTPGAEGGWKGA